MVWTADQVIKLVGEIGTIVGGIGVISQALHNNKAIALNSSNNAHETLMNATTQNKVLSVPDPNGVSGIDVNNNKG